MIRILILLFALNIVNHLNAQNAIQFEWDVLRIGFVRASNINGAHEGMNLGSELRLHYNDKWSTGLRTEIALYEDQSSGSLFGTVLISSFSAMQEYNFSPSNEFRPLIGAGLGVFSSSNRGFSLGLVPRFGFEYGFLRLTAESNLILKDKAHDYFSINLGFTLWNND